MRCSAQYYRGVCRRSRTRSSCPDSSDQLPHRPRPPPPPHHSREHWHGDTHGGETQSLYTVTRQPSFITQSGGVFKVSLLHPLKINYYLQIPFSLINAGQSLNIVHDEGSLDNPKVGLPGEASSPGMSEVPADHIGVLNAPTVVTDRTASNLDVPGQGGSLPSIQTNGPPG